MFLAGAMNKGKLARAAAPTIYAQTILIRIELPSISLREFQHDRFALPFVSRHPIQLDVRFGLGRSPSRNGSD